MTYAVLSPIFILLAFSFAIMLMSVFVKSQRRYYAYFSLFGLIVALLLVLDMAGLSFTSAMGLDLWSSPVDVYFPDLKIKVDAFSLFLYMVFIIVGILVTIGSISYIGKEEKYRAEYFSLMLLALVGMMLIASATDLFVLYLAFELASISTYALAAFQRKDKASAEAGLKFFLMGAVSSAIALFGISIIYGVTAFAGGATTDLNGISDALAVGLTMEGMTVPIILGVVLLIAGFGFKIAVVPFHMWAPDVYQGSPTTISAFLAAGSKKGGFAAFFKIFLVGLIAARMEWVFLVAVLAVVTMVVGNILAIVQTDLKRMLAYSSIAQAGYVLIAVCVGTLAADPATLNVAQYGLAGGLYHILTHAFMKSGAFLVVALTTMAKIGDNLNDYKGLYKRMPVVAFCMMVLLLALAGIPPLGGFFSKFVLFSSAVNAGDWFVWLAVFGVLNSVISLYYYARVIKYMYILKGTDETRVKAPTGLYIAVILATVGIVITGLLAEPIIRFAQDAAVALLG
jgi:NADH-quinone oxidoreductase subunit N